MSDAPDGRRTPPRVRVTEAGRRLRSDRGRLGIAVAAAVGLVLRVVVVLWASRTPQGLVDPARYFRYAEAIGRGEGMVEVLSGGEPTAYFPPGYPYFLGAIQAVLTHTPLPDDLPLYGGLANAVVGAVSIVLVGLLARRLASPAAGVVAAALLAVYPNLVLHTAALLSETLSIALLLGFLLALVPPGTGRWPGPLVGRRLVGAGLLLGGLLLVRPVTVGVAGAAVVAWLVAGEGWRRTATRTAAVVGVALLCLAPWTVRNLVRMDAFVPLSTNTGDNLCIGHAPTAGGGFDQPVECMTGTGVQGGIEDEVSSNDEKTRRALRFAREGWRREPGLTVNRIEILLERDDDSVRALQSYGAGPVGHRRPREAPRGHPQRDLVRGRRPGRGGTRPPGLEPQGRAAAAPPGGAGGAGRAAADLRRLPLQGADRPPAHRGGGRPAHPLRPGPARGGLTRPSQGRSGRHRRATATSGGVTRFRTR